MRASPSCTIAQQSRSATPIPAEPGTKEEIFLVTEFLTFDLARGSYFAGLRNSGGTDDIALTFAGVLFVRELICFV